MSTNQRQVEQTEVEMGNRKFPPTAFTLNIILFTLL